MTHTAAHSRFVTRVRRRYADELPLLPSGLPDWPALQNTLAALRARGFDSGSALRVLRQLVLERLAVLDCEAAATMPEIGQAMTTLAEFSLHIAHAWSLNDLHPRHGTPESPLWVIGMGKLGARELNVSSDIDLVCVYEHEGQSSGLPDGRGRIDHAEFFARMVRGLQQLLGEVTEHGFVFRLDWALRPNGLSGPVAVSLSALEEYFQVQGREWERFAWLKSRIIAPESAMHGAQAHALRSVVLPFVFRRYLDYGVFDALRQLHAQIHLQAELSAKGRPERLHDVKLGRGGIREIEFTAQLLQVVRGGQFPELRQRNTLKALSALTRAGLMSAPTSQALAEAYVFLRQVEHRIQYLDDQQTHVLPSDEADLDWIARTMGHSDTALWSQNLQAHRERVAQEFDALLGGPHPESPGSLGMPPARLSTRAPVQTSPLASAPTQARANPIDEPNKVAAPSPLPADQIEEELRGRLQAWSQQSRFQNLRESTQKHLQELLQRSLQYLHQAELHIGPDALLRSLDWLDALLRRETYLSLLQERPRVHQRVLRLLGAARWSARYLLQHPGVMDELASDEWLNERFERDAFLQELQWRQRALHSSGQDDDENLLNALRRAQHAEVFRTLARDVEGVLSVSQVADDLSALADAVLGLSAQWCWSRLKTAHRSDPQWAVIAYGKLGGRELGYGSDLDLVFVYDDAHESAHEIYTAFSRKWLSWLSVKTAEGDLYEIDTALRPNGQSGLLITSLAAYTHYQSQRGANTAWTWEHQAMTRARFVLGPDTLRTAFEDIRHQVLTAPRQQAALRQEIQAMRQRMRHAHPEKPERFDLKHDRGGMIDAEFAVQYLVLAHAKEHPELAQNAGNMALMQSAEQAGLLPPHIGQAASAAYETLRAQQHQARLDERPAVAPAQDWLAQRQAIEALWNCVFEN